MYSEVGETLSFIIYKALSNSNTDKKSSFFQLLKLHCKSESPGEFLIPWIRGGAGKFAFSTSSGKCWCCPSCDLTLRITGLDF